MAQVSLLIVSWNSRSRLQRCLGSLPRTNVEIIVTDNASGDGSADMVAAEYPEITLIRETENRGFAAAINLAVQRATSPLVLLPNADVEIFPDAIDSLSSFLDTNPAYGAAGGRLVDADGQFQRGFSVRRFPTMASFAVDLLLLDTVWPNNPVSRRYHAADLDDRVTQPVDQPAAACLMVRRAALEQLGGLDERFYPAWFEDVDLCRRLKAAGWEIAFVAEADVSARRRRGDDDSLAHSVLADLVQESQAIRREASRTAGRTHDPSARGGGYGRAVRGLDGHGSAGPHGGLPSGTGRRVAVRLVTNGSRHVELDVWLSHTGGSRMFTTRTLTFLRQLRRHNDRAWFQANRDRYEADVKQPMIALIQRMGSDLPRFAPNLQASTRSSMYRIYRDTRFSADKSPYKTRVSAFFPHRTLPKHAGAGLYLEVSPERVLVGGGLYAPESADLQRVRASIVEHWTDFRRIVKGRDFARTFTALDGKRLTRSPRGFPSDHPGVEYLKLKQFLAGCQAEPDLATTARFYPFVLQRFRQLAPFIAFLNDAIIDGRQATSDPLR